MWFKVSKASDLSIELRDYLKRCGLSERKVTRCSGNTRMYHDLGLYGDVAEACMEELSNYYHVDLNGFESDKFFPPEFPGKNACIGALLSIVPFAGYVARQRGEYLPLTLEMIENVMRAKQWRAVAPVIRQYSLRHLADVFGVPEPVGELTSMYLKRCGYSAPEIESWTSETMLLHDLGLCGDDILDDFSILRNEFGVDLSDFDFGKYFPNELSKEAYLVSMHRILCAIGLQKVANRIYKRRLARVCSKYPAVSLGMIEATLKRRKWIVAREQ